MIRKHRGQLQQRLPNTLRHLNQVGSGAQLGHKREKETATRVGESGYLWPYIPHQLSFTSSSLWLTRRSAFKDTNRDALDCSAVWYLWEWKPGDAEWLLDSHMKLAQLYEDKGKACAGLGPSSSIWVLSSLGPGGMGAYMNMGCPSWIYCPLVAWEERCSGRAWLVAADLWDRFDDRWTSNETSHSS